MMNPDKYVNNFNPVEMDKSPRLDSSLDTSLT